MTTITRNSSSRIVKRSRVFVGVYVNPHQSTANPDAYSIGESRYPSVTSLNFQVGLVFGAGSEVIISNPPANTVRHVYYTMIGYLRDQKKVELVVSAGADK